MFYSALLGNPVDHSISPALFSMLAEYTKIEYAHLKIKINSPQDLKKNLSYLNKLNFKGVNITLPYKIKVIKHLNKLNDEAKQIGAVNTIVFKNNKFIGYNTDAIGALLAIEKKLKKIKKNDQIMIIGAGGAARAVIYELYQRCDNIIIINNSIKEAKKLSNDFYEKRKNKEKIKVFELNNNNLKKYLNLSNLIINATPVGMHPNANNEIISEKILNQTKNLENKYFFDVIFNPYKTKFLLNAEKRGAKVCSGLYMMIFQALYAFKLWTNINVENINTNNIKNKLIQSLKSHK